MKIILFQHEIIYLIESDLDVLSDGTLTTEEENSNYDIDMKKKLEKECVSDTGQITTLAATTDRVTSSSDASDDIAIPRGSNSTECGIISSKNRRRRTAFSTHQLIELEREFQAKKYLSLTERSQIAHELSLSEVTK